jgi:hypothetical protein
MRLTYIYHSGFAIEHPNFTIIIDYYEDSLGEGRGVVHDRLLHRPQKLYVLASHSHPDHFNPEILNWRDIRSDITYVFSKDIETMSGVSDLKYKNISFVDKGEVYTDELLQIYAFGSTDLGISFKLKFDEMVMFHAGDLNNWHWNEESTVDEITEAEKVYMKELNHIASYTSCLDLALFPVDPRLGKDYMLGAEEFLSKIPTKLFVPMHFGESYEKAEAIRVVAEKYNTKVYVPPRRGEILDHIENIIDNI